MESNAIKRPSQSAGDNEATEEIPGEYMVSLMGSPPEIIPEDLLNPATLVDLLRYRAERQPLQNAYTFLSEGGPEDAEVSLTYEAVDRKARAIAAMLQSAAARGERVLLLYPPGLEYISAFFGCLYAGAIAVPAYPPRINNTRARLDAIARDASPKLALTTESIRSKARALLEGAPALKGVIWLTSDETDVDLAHRWVEPRVRPGDLAFLQYTSGSTAAPRGVMISHENVLYNQKLIKKVFRQNRHSVIVGWLPLYHDMGLIGNVLQPLYVGARCVLMSPMAFLTRPFRWLDAISRHHATTSGGPNFAYELCVRKIGPDQRASLDLSSWAVAFNGAEPIRGETIDRFAQAFESCGFQREAFATCYGLAEATLIVSGSRKPNTPVVTSFEPKTLETCRPAEKSRGRQEGRQLVSCGSPNSAQKVVIVDLETLSPCGPSQIGEIWVKGRSVAKGYWNLSEETQRVFSNYLPQTGDGPYLRTGDLGFVHQGQLYVTGRIKDLIIIRGINHYPQDVELTVEQSHPALRPGCGAAFSLEVSGEERLAVAHEVDVRQHPDIEAVLEAIRGAVTDQHEVQLYAIALIRPGAIPKTSSGKIQRQACKAAFLSGNLQIVGSWKQAEAAAYVNEEAAERLLDQGQRDLRWWLASRVAARAGIHGSSIDLDQPVSRYGLDSMTAIELMHEVESEFGARLPIITFLQDLSIAEIALLLESRPSGGSSSAESRADQNPNIWPLSQGQRALWFLHRLAPDSAAYNIAGAVRVRGHLNADALCSVFQKLVDRHPTLRSTFPAIEGEPASHLGPGDDVELEVRDASSLDDDSFNDLLSAFANRPFELEQGPLFEVVLFARSEQEHVLLLVMHHIIADFWSLGVLLHELGALYRAEVDGTSEPLAPLSSRYSDYAKWQESMLAGIGGLRLRKFWEERLSGDLPLLDLPTDFPRPPAQTFSGASISFKIDGKTTYALNQLAKANGATVYMALLAAFQVLLSRYSGQEDILVGSPMAGRSAAEFAGLVGYFVNPVVMRGDLSNNPSFVDLLWRTREMVLAALDHQDYPFPLLVERLQPKRDASRSPLFQVMFVLQKAPMFADERLSAFALGEDGASMKIGDLQLESVSLKRCAAQFDLTLTMAEVGGGLGASLQYNTALFRPETISLMAGHFQMLLEAVTANPRERVADLPILTAAEEEFLSGLNEFRTPFPSQTVHDLFEAQALRTPERIALVFGEERLTYSELSARSSSLSHHLKLLGAGPDACVGLFVERSVEMVIAMYAVLKAGTAYIPLDPAYPKERLACIVEDARPIMLLTQRSLADALAGCGVNSICVDDGWPHVEGEAGDWVNWNVTPANLAYVIYTSGSTGTPKGVAIQHSSAVAMIQWANTVYSSEEMEGTLASTSICFDLSVFELFAPLSRGGKVILAQNALSLPELAAKEEVTLVNTVPSAIADLLRAKAISDGVLTVNLAGEPLPNSLAQQIYENTKAERVYNLYGPSEDTTYSTRALVAQGAESVTIGRPIVNSRAHILDAGLKRSPMGVPGELYMAGDGLARGYLNRPDLTAERFLPEPFDGEPGDRMYRTGDLGRFRPDGGIEFLGRLDHQVKIRGFRIELQEIDAVLRRHADVVEATVVVREYESGDKRIVAYVVPREGARPEPSELRAFLRQRLPEFMIPSALVPLQRMPLTPNGKIDRGSLPAPEHSLGEEGGAGSACSSAVEELVAGIFARVLNVDRVGTDNSFFDLGGHSLLATQVISRVREAFGIDLPLQVMFGSASVSALAGEIEARLREGQTSPNLPIPTSRLDGAHPLSSAQQRLWFLARMEPDSPFYNVPHGVRLSGDLALDALAQAIDEITRRHETLRTTFKVVLEEAVQEVHGWERAALPVVDISGLSAEEAESTVERLTRQEARAVFNLETGPPARTRLFRFSQRDDLLLITTHHIISDGWSTRVLVQEIKSLYGSFVTGGNSKLPELPVRYRDCVAWQRQRLSDERLELKVQYWKDRLGDDHSALTLPFDRPRPTIQSYSGAEERFEIDSRLTAALRELTRQEGVTMYMALLAVFNVMLARYSGQDAINIGSPVAGRDRTEIEGLIGLFVNTVVMRTDLGGNPSFTEAVKRVRETSIGAHTHQDVPFETLVDRLQVERSPSHSPLFQVMFVFQNVPVGAIDLPGLTATRVDVSNGAAKFDLMLSFEEDQGRLRGTIEYDTDLFDPPTIRRLARNYQTLLDAFIANPGQRIREAPMIAPHDLQRILEEWNNTRRECDGKRIHRLYEEQAERTPARIALRFGNSQITYRELNERANQVARYLRKLGVGLETRVAVSMQRGIELVAVLLGVLKSGAAYLPLDPAYPEERRAFMLEDSGAQVVIQEGAGNSAAGLTVVSIEAEWGEIERENRRNLDVEAHAANAAYLIYTSGSTGKPKGAVVEHAQLSNLLNSIRREPGFSEDDVLLGITTISFDIGSLEVFLPLIVGAQTVLASRDAAVDASQLKRLIDESKATVMQATPTTWRMLLEAGWQGSKGLRAFCGGENLLRDLAGRLLEECASAWNMYGPTETTIYSALCAVEPENGPVPIGRPIDNTELYVLDAYFQPAPTGVPGELYIGGAGVGRGYLNQSGLTAERFLPDPFGNSTGGRLYRSGDLARFLDDGRIDCMGRIDQQVKIRGFRVEPGEVEAALGCHPSVARAAIIAREDDPGDKRLVAYVVAAEGAVVSPSELGGFLRARLPEYMTPSSFVALESLPLTPSGKLDRRALPKPSEARPAIQTVFVAPRDPVEETLTRIFQEVLKVDRVGIHDSFFDLGGHSILAMQIALRVHNEFKVELPLRTLFKSPTIAQISEAIQNAKRAKPATSRSKIKPFAREQFRKTLPLGR